MLKLLEFMEEFGVLGIVDVVEFKCVGEVWEFSEGDFNGDCMIEDFFDECDVLFMFMGVVDDIVCCWF